VHKHFSKAAVCRAHAAGADIQCSSAARLSGSKGAAMSMNWNQLLCAERLGRASKPQPHDPARSEFRRDSDRLTFSTAFRRLQDKTQVFPLADNDYVRTRLTHSLEVASVGRSLGARVGTHIAQRHRLAQHGSEFGEIVAAAGLAHDLGNPPFGHSGEDAIRHWFQTSPVAAAAGAELSAAERADIERYEGNAQGFRLITRLQMPDNPGGLQLTHATLGAFTKYPRESVVPAELPRGASGKKFGFCQSEREHFASVAEHCGLLRRTPDAAWWARHPLAFLVEAADDICYRLVDFEDGMRTGHLSYGQVRDAFLALIPAKQHPRRLREAHDDTRRVQILRAVAIGAAIEEATEVFLAHERDILAGRFDQPLIDAGPSCAVWEKIMRRSRKTIYNTARGVEIEAAGFAVLGGLLDDFVASLNDLAAHGKKAAARSHKLLALVPAQCLARQRTAPRDPYVRLLSMLDFISGMTDTYAVALYRKVRGISLTGR
jgi:dGTPase